MENIICFYHNDLDGRCAGSIVAEFENNYDKKRFFEVNYNQNLPIESITKKDKVYLVDYSFKEDTIWQLEKILEITKDVIWLDHHTSSMNCQKKFSWLKDIKGIRQEGISGAGLTYMYLYNYAFDDLPYYIKLVSDYDCWIYDFNPDTTFFKIGIETEDYNALDDIWNNLFKGNYYFTKDEYIQDILDKGKVIKSYIDKDNIQYRDSYSFESELDGYKCIVVNKRTNSWIFGDKLKEYPFGIIFVYNGEWYSYSIFSENKDIDCSKIAENHGGGGHKGAAGFKSKINIFEKKE
jgi:oligoribonuclease NrnB/cAMP/cGMP phosphodiesterase (DHH superfamily)